MGALRTWSLHKTPHPSERTFSVLAGMNEIALKTAEFDAYVEGSLFSAFPLIPDPDLATEAQFGNYVFTGTDNNDPDRLRYFFAKNKTTEEANTPFRSTTYKGNHRWPPILVDLKVIPDFGNPRSFPVASGTDIGTGFAPSYFELIEYIPDVSEGTRFVKDEFFGPTKFNIPQTPVPVCVGVNYALPGGGSGSFPECLHDKIKLDGLMTCQSQIVAGVSSLIGTTIPEQVFEATNFIDWSPYVLSDNQEQADGGWYRVRIRVFPPPQPESVKQRNQ